MAQDLPAKPSRTWRTFVFDDDAAVRALLTRILRRRGHQVTAFSRPSPCSNCPCDEHSRCADIIISDISMPEIDGIEFLAQQRQVGCNVAHLALMSGRWTAETWERAQALTIQPFHKPFDLDMLQFWLSTCEGPDQPSRKLAPWYERNATDDGRPEKLRD